MSGLEYAVYFLAADELTIVDTSLSQLTLLIPSDFITHAIHHAIVIVLHFDHVKIEAQAHSLIALSRTCHMPLPLLRHLHNLIGLTGILRSSL